MLLQAERSELAGKASLTGRGRKVQPRAVRSLAFPAISIIPFVKAVRWVGVAA